MLSLSIITSSGNSNFYFFYFFIIPPRHPFKRFLLSPLAIFFYSRNLTAAALWHSLVISFRFCFVSFICQQVHLLTLVLLEFQDQKGISNQKYEVDHCLEVFLKSKVYDISINPWTNYFQNLHHLRHKIIFLFPSISKQYLPNTSFISIFIFISVAFHFFNSLNESLQSFELLNF